jgi:RNA polymerase sigma factor (sigma-70 family)
VRAFAARLGSMAAAEDLAQDLYLKLAAMDPDTQIENLSAFLYRVGSNLMLDRLRQESRAAARDRQWRETSTTSVAGQDVAREPPADVSLLWRQRLAQLGEAVDDLPPRMRHAFRLHKLEGLSQAETAKVMGVSVKAVEKQISAALKALLKRLDTP